MRQTEHFGLKKPDTNDYYDIQEGNANLDVIDQTLHDHGQQLAPGQAKEAPAGADTFVLRDSTEEGAPAKRITWTAIVAAVKAALGELYAAATHKHAAGDINSGTLATARLPTIPLTKGGTGATTAAAARSNLGACAVFAPVTVTVALESWSGTGPWTQTVSVSGVTASDNGLGVYPVDVADGDARKLYEKAYGCLAAEAETVAGGVKLTCRDAKPEIAFQVIVKGVR